MNEKVKNILKIAGIYYFVSFIIVYLFDLFNNNFAITTVFTNIWQNLLFPMVAAGLFVIIFSPAILVLYFIFKKIKNIKIRIVLTAFLIPFTNMVYYLIENVLFRGDTIISLVIGAYSLFVILPLSFISTVFIPKKWLPIKWQTLITVILMEIFGWLLIMFLGFLSSIEDKYITSKLEAKDLEKYEIIIQDLENYKTKNGVYPKTVEDSVKKFESFYYTPINSDKDYIITVYNLYTKKFNYCTSTEPEGCHPESKGYADYEQFGKWIKDIEKD